MEKLKRVIGHALQNIVPCQLQYYAALLYKLVSFEDLIDNKPAKSADSQQKIKMLMVWPNNEKVINYMPPIKGPVSSVQFWLNHLNLSMDQDISSFADNGYVSLQELIAEMVGFYAFYKQPRFVFRLYSNLIQI